MTLKNSGVALQYQKKFVYFIKPPHDEEKEIKEQDESSAINVQW